VLAAGGCWVLSCSVAVVGVDVAVDVVVVVYVVDGGCCGADYFSGCCVWLVSVCVC
jgi:hypothetical protein